MEVTFATLLDNKNVWSSVLAKRVKITPIPWLDGRSYRFSFEADVLKLDKEHVVAFSTNRNTMTIIDRLTGGRHFPLKI